MAEALSGKVAVVTGSGRGIGRAIARKLASHGAAVVVNDLDAGPAGETVDELRKAGARALPFAGNVTTPDFGEKLIAAAVSEFGSVDIIVNNAGYTWDNVIQKMQDDQWYAMLDVHATAPFRILRAALPHIRKALEREKAEGRRVMRKVVNITSVSGIFGNAGQAGYAAGKAAVIGLTKALAKEWGRYNVNVNCVGFGLIETRLTQPLTGAEATISVEGRQIAVGVQPAAIAGVKTLCPLGRAGTPEEAAGAVDFFTSPDSDYVSGQVLVVNGGTN